MTNAEARFNIASRPRKPEGSLGRTAQDGHLDSHTAPELCKEDVLLVEFMYLVFTRTPGKRYRGRLGSLLLYLCYVSGALINSLECWLWAMIVQGLSAGLESKGRRFKSRSGRSGGRILLSRVNFLC